MLVFLVGTGVYVTVGLRFIQVRRLPFVFKQALGSMFVKGSENQGRRHTLAQPSGLSSTIGVGNIVGVSTALFLGGAGALFWMWVAGFFGMGTKYAEIVLSIHYREKDKTAGFFQGGPPWYMQKGLYSPILTIVFAVAPALVCISGNMIQANAIAKQAENTIGLPPLAVVLVSLVGLVTIGRIKRLGAVAGKLVPTMAESYVLAAMVLSVTHISQLPDVVSAIFVGAFVPLAAGGSEAGIACKEAIKFGVQRGLHSNEAGEGTAPIAYAAAKTDHPARTGLRGITGIFLGHVGCLLDTGFTILMSGVLSSDASPGSPGDHGVRHGQSGL